MRELQRTNSLSSQFMVSGLSSLDDKHCPLTLGWIMLTLFTVSAIYHLTCLLAGIYPDGKFYK